LKIEFIFKKILISLFFIAQRAVQSGIIANLQEIIMGNDFFLHLERKAPKFKPQKGPFMGK
jgi:hypothetical protein